MDPGSGPHCPMEEFAMADQIPKLQSGAKSLVSLTSRFIGLLLEAENGELDLKEAARVLAFEHKRRVYDITNVLEGIGLIVKKSPSIIKWKGPIPAKNPLEMTKKLMKLTNELEYLGQKEYVLDQQRFSIEESIRSTIEHSSHLTYVSHEDICNSFSGRLRDSTVQNSPAFIDVNVHPEVYFKSVTNTAIEGQDGPYITFSPGHTVLAVRAPSGTQLDVPIPKAVQNCPAKYQIHLKSVNGPIDVMLLYKRSVSSAPVVLPVPPPEIMLGREGPSESTSHETENSFPKFPPWQAAGYTKHIPRLRPTALENMRHLQTSFAPNRTDTPELQNLSKELKELLQPTKELLNKNFIRELLTSEGIKP